MAPSYDLLKITSIESEIKLSSNRAGEVFLIDSPSSRYKQFYFNNIELSSVNKTKYFGTIPLYNKERALLTGFSEISKPLIFHPTQNKMFFITSIKTRKLNNPSSIRIPANFFKKLENAEDTQIEEEKFLIKSSLKKERSVDSFCFDVQMPLRSKIVSKFGSYRMLPTGYRYFHTGLDLRAALGTPIYAMADGQVALAQKFLIPGNAVIIDHGNAIFSKYYHLSKVLVKPGEKVKKGVLIGKSGGTGRVEAPHFHWEITWRGLPTDPLIFLKTLKSNCI